MSRVVNIVALILPFVLVIGGLFTSWGSDALQQLVTWMFDTQRQLNRSLANGMMAVDTLSIGHVMTLMAMSFGYGIFHAVGPGHGKAVIATYLLTQRAELRQGIFMTVMASLLQGLTAIVLVGTLSGLLGWFSQEVADVVPWLEQLSFLGIALLGAAILWRTGRQLRRRGECAPGCHCHSPTAGRDRTMRWGAILSIGLRPCSGAIILLGVAMLIGCGLWGMLAVMVMAVGTAITTSALAALSVLMKGVAVRVWQYSPPVDWRYLQQGVALCGGTVLLVLGLMCMHYATSDYLSEGRLLPGKPASLHPFALKRAL